MKPVFRRAASPVFRELLARDVRPGASLELLTPAPLPHDLSWAAADPIIAEAFGRAAAVFESVGSRVLPEPVRGLIAARLDEWRGEDLGISRGWVETAIEALPPAQRPLGRLTLLVAFASYQVDAGVIDSARQQFGSEGDEALVAAAGWASFTAARRIGSWLYPGHRHQTRPDVTDERLDSSSRGRH